MCSNIVIKRSAEIVSSMINIDQPYQSEWPIISQLSWEPCVDCRKIDYLVSRIPRTRVNCDSINWRYASFGNTVYMHLCCKTYARACLSYGNYICQRHIIGTQYRRNMRSGVICLGRGRGDLHVRVWWYLTNLEFITSIMTMVYIPLI